MSEANKNVIRRYLAAVDQGDVRVLDEFVAPDFVDHNPFPGTTPDLAGLKQAFEIFLHGTPGYHTVDDLLAEGDKVAGRITGYGTHTGELLGVAPTGRQVQIAGIVIWRIRDGKIVERWSQVDALSLLQQIGAFSAPPSHTS